MDIIDLTSHEHSFRMVFENAPLPYTENVVFKQQTNIRPLILSSFFPSQIDVSIIVKALSTFCLHFIIFSLNRATLNMPFDVGSTRLPSVAAISYF